MSRALLLWLSAALMLGACAGLRGGGPTMAEVSGVYHRVSPGATLRTDASVVQEEGDALTVELYADSTFMWAYDRDFLYAHGQGRLFPLGGGRFLANTYGQPPVPEAYHTGRDSLIVRVLPEGGDVGRYPPTYVRVRCAGDPEPHSAPIDADGLARFGRCTPTALGAGLDHFIAFPWWVRVPRVDWGPCEREPCPIRNEAADSVVVRVPTFISSLSRFSATDEVWVVEGERLRLNVGADGARALVLTRRAGERP